jgi:hypothetical protein
MAYNDGDPLWVVPTKIAPRSLPLEEGFRPLKQSAMNLRLPKRTVSPRENPPHIRHLMSVATMSVNE